MPSWTMGCCGGLDALFDVPKDPEHEEVKEWMAEMEPAEFDIALVNKRLAKLK